MKNFIKFTAVLFAAITLSALMAHLLELRVKIDLSKADYQTVQGIYSGWQWLGIFEIGTIALTIIWMILERKAKKRYQLLLSALFCFIVSIAIFFIFTFPTNEATGSWTALPTNWNDLRQTWEYSHAARACLSLVGFSLLVGTLLKKDMTFKE